MTAVQLWIIIPIADTAEFQVSILTQMKANKNIYSVKVMFWNLILLSTNEVTSIFLNFHSDIQAMDCLGLGVVCK
jgi:hypothetical protein